MTTTGAVMMALAWLMLGRFALGNRRMSRSQLDRTLLLWALPLLIAPPMYSKDVYSYLAQSQIARIGLDPYRVGPAPGLGLDHVFTLSVPSLWRETPGALRTAVPVDRARNLGADRREHRRGRAVPPAGRAARRRADRLGHPAAGPPLRGGRGQRAVAGPGQPAAVHAPGRGHPQRGADAGPDAGGHRVRAARRSMRTARAAARGRWTGRTAAASGRAGIRWRMLLAGHRADHDVVAGEAAVAAGAGLRRDGAGVPVGRHASRRSWSPAGR